MCNTDQMKHLLTAIACFFALSMSAQFIPQQMGYNPDVDGDEVIGVNDLMGTLSLYGSLFDNGDSLNVTSWTFPQDYPIPPTEEEDAFGMVVNVDIPENTDILYVHQTVDRMVMFHLPQGEGFKVLQLFLSCEGFYQWGSNILLNESPLSEAWGNTIDVNSNRPMHLILIRGHNGIWYESGFSLNN